MCKLQERKSEFMATWNTALKRLSAGLIAFILLLSLAACGAGEAEEGLPEATDSLVVYAGPYVADFLGSAVRRFETLYPDVEVEVRDFGDSSDKQNEENYLEVLKNELAAGAGPDLILFTNDEFEDVEKTAESGAFQDLSGYIAGDADFNLDDYNTAVLNAGVFDGQRLFVPISYTVDIMLTTQEALTAVNEKLPTTFADWCEQMVSYGQTYRDDTSRFFTQSYNVFDALLRASALPIVDYTTKEVTVDNDDFSSLMSAYKELYDMEWGRSEEGIYAQDPNVYYGEDVLLIQSGKFLYIQESYMYLFVFDYAALLYSYMLVVPLSAVWETANGALVIYTVETRGGLFGEETYIKELPIKEVIKNNVSMAISGEGVHEFLEVVTATDRPLTDGETVKVTG